METSKDKTLCRKLWNTWHAHGWQRQQWGDVITEIAGRTKVNLQTEKEVSK